jgi:ABC-2 type transport system ATP-binding protein
MLSLRSVTKRYGDLTALNDVSLEIQPGEFFGLLGPNGAGKSTLMSLVAGLRKPDAGQVIVDGQPLGPNSHQVRRVIGLVPQSVALYLDLSADENLKIFGGLYGIHGQELRARMEEVLTATQLIDRRKERIKTFSGGMLRRLNIAATLLHKPKILLCDEPTVGVDPQSRNAIFEHLQQLNRQGVTIIYSTHYMEEAERLCSRIGIIDHGKLLALGTLDVLISQLPFQEEITFPADAGTAALTDRLSSFGEVAQVNSTVRFRSRQDFSRSQFYHLTEGLGVNPRIFHHERPTLEALFLQLTGRTLRD